VDAVAVTMTAELCDCFPTKRRGVQFVLEAARRAFGETDLFVLDTAGGWRPVTDAVRASARVASANWVATAALAGAYHQCTVLMDVGSTTTDIIPVMAGRARPRGRTDPTRLASGELLYTGALRTDVAAIVQRLPLRGRWIGVAAERFAVSGDVHMLLGHLMPEEYACVPPDGGERSIAGARRRLARVVCADEELLTPREIEDMALFVHHRQVTMITESLVQVLSAMRVRPPVITVTGMGAFLASAAAARVGLGVDDLTRVLGLAGNVPVSAVAAGWLLARHLSGGNGRPEEL
jgi:probable H4MPT-linked C1 transfer pathway protein